MAEEELQVEVVGLGEEETEDEEEIEQGVDYSQPMNGPGEINEGQPALWLSAEDAADEDVAPKDLTDFAVQVSVEFLESLGLGQYSGVIEKNKLGIESLVNMSFDALGDYIPDLKDRALILGRAKKVFVRSSAPRVDGRPVKVMAKFGIARISEINTVDLTARIKLFIDLYWHDPRMIGARSDQIPNYIWIPDCYVYNCTQRSGENGGKLNIHPVSLVDSSTGLLLNALEVEVVLTNDMNLRNFPFDSDDIQMILLQSEDSSSSEWIFVPWEGGDGTENCVKCFYDIFETPEFDINGWSLDMFRSYTGGNNVSYATCHLRIHMSRRPYYYIRNILVPIMLTTTLAFTAFFYDIDQLEERNNGTATTFLTTVAFLYVITSSLPKTNYTTSINFSVVLSFVVQLIIWALTNINFLISKQDPDSAYQIDYYAAIILPIIYYLATALLFVPKLVVSHYKTRMSKPPFRQLEPAGGQIRDWRQPIFEKKGELKYFPFIEGKNVFS